AACWCSFSPYLSDCTRVPANEISGGKPGASGPPRPSPRGPQRNPAINASYAAVCANASAASRRLVGPSGVQLLEDLRVPFGSHDDDDGLVVLGRGADHRGAADVDLLDCILEGDAGAADGLDEGI